MDVNNLANEIGKDTIQKHLAVQVSIALLTNQALVQGLCCNEEMVSDKYF
jgi:hypothetical protein